MRSVAEETEGFLAWFISALPWYHPPLVGRADPNVHMLKDRRSLSIK